MSEWKRFDSPLSRIATASTGILQPDTSPQTIQQIANAMSDIHNTPGLPISDAPDDIKSRCDNILAGMPDIVETDGNRGVVEPPNELKKLLDSGHRPLEKNNGSWKESPSDSHHKKDNLLLG